MYSQFCYNTTYASLESLSYAKLCNKNHRAYGGKGVNGFLKRQESNKESQVLYMLND